jgi:hypothetical protein
MTNIFADFLQAINEILATAIVILAFSMLLYNLTRDLHNRIARTSGAVLACVTFPYVCDVFLSLQPETSVGIVVVRLQWIGIAFMPATLFHLSDALLATTGLPSRGRRRRIIRILYLISAVFLLAATLTDTIIKPIANGNISIEAGNLAFLYITYFISLVMVTFINMQRARQRCLTRTTKRRMGYLQYAILTPALGIFPFSIFINSGDEHAAPIILLVILANIVVIGMLIFLSYPLSFFGSDKPDRVVKVELLHFLLRGPGTALLALTTIVFTSRATQILGLASEAFLPLAVVATVLMWQWFIALAIPYIETFLIYRDEGDDQLAKLQDFNERVLTKTDLLQFSEATLEAICDLLRAEVAFLIAVKDEDFDVVQTVGTDSIQINVQDHIDELRAYLNTIIAQEHPEKRFETWGEYQLLPLHTQRLANGHSVIGILGIKASLSDIANFDLDTLHTYTRRAEQTLEDLRLQAEIFSALEGLLPQISTTRPRVDEIEYRPSPNKITSISATPDREETYEQVRAALRHYWGGPGMSRSRLLDLKIVQTEIAPNDLPAHALRNIIQQAVERQRPEGERSYIAPEWTIYNILTLRFLEGKKVRDVARRMSMSEADLYRKQRLAIEAVAETLLEMELELKNKQ